MNSYSLREDLPKRAVVIIYILLGLGFPYYIYFKQFVTPFLPQNLERFHDIGFLYLWCIVMLLVFFWYRQYTITLELKPDQLVIVYKKGSRNLRTEVFQKSTIVSLEPEGIKRANSSMATLYLHLATTTHPTKTFIMNSYKEMESITSHWNDLQYPHVHLKSMEEYKKEWKANSTRFIIIYFSFLTFLGLLIYLLLK